MATTSNGTTDLSGKTDKKLQGLSSRLTKREQTLRQRLTKVNDSLLKVGRLMRSSKKGSQAEARHRERAMLTLRRKQAAERQLNITMGMVEQVEDVISAREQGHLTTESVEIARMAQDVGTTIQDLSIDADADGSVEAILGAQVWQTERDGVDDSQLAAELEEELEQEMQEHRRKRGHGDKSSVPSVSSRPLDNSVDESIGEADGPWIDQLGDEDDEELAQAADILRQSVRRALQPE